MLHITYAIFSYFTMKISILKRNNTIDYTSGYFLINYISNSAMYLIDFHLFNIKLPKEWILFVD